MTRGLGDETSSAYSQTLNGQVILFFQIKKNNPERGFRVFKIFLCSGPEKNPFKK